jgi:two-component system sensor histidine kinase BarA
MKQFSIKWQILLIAMTPVFFIDTFLTYVHISSSIDQAEQTILSKGELIAKQLAGASEFNLYSGNYAQIQNLLNQSVNTNDIIFSAVYNIEGQVIAKAEGTGYSDNLTNEYFYFRHIIESETIDSNDIFEPDTSTIQNLRNNIGWIHLYISKHQLVETEKQIFTEGLVFFSILLLLAVLLTAIISRRITRPIFTLLEHLKSVEKGYLGQTIKKIERNEIGDVQKGFNNMTRSLLMNQKELDQKIKSANHELREAIADLEYKNHELAVARDQAQNAARIKSKFLANISHEIRTPINGIQGFINLLSRTGLKQEQKRYTDIISQSTKDLSAIVNEVLDYSKIESGKIEIFETEFDLIELVESTRDSLYTGAMDKEIDLHLTIYSDTPRMVIGDPLRLKQILINLIGNAIKFTDQGYVNVTVLMKDENEEKVVIKIFVEDSGIGISEPDQASLFQAFKQIESDTNRRFSGTGLGLVISKNLALLMGGDITLQSVAGAGSFFALAIPFKPANRQVISANPFAGKIVLIISFDHYCQNEINTLFSRIGFDTENLLIERNSDLNEISKQIMQNLTYFNLVIVDCRHSFAHPNKFITPKVKERVSVMMMHYDRNLVDPDLLTEYPYLSVINTSNNLLKTLSGQQLSLDNLQHSPNLDHSTDPKKVLLVDDNPINLMLARELTEIWGHRAFEASNAQEAMNFFNNMAFDLILLDIHMPETDGIELMNMMRQQQPGLKTPIAAITADIMETDKERLLKLGFDSYISKPIEEEKLRKLLDQDFLFDEDSPDQKIRTDQYSSIDYDLSVKLSANNNQLAEDTLMMLQKELPDHLKALLSAMESSSTEETATILHKLNGVTCYAGLPRLKYLLSNFYNVKKMNHQIMSKKSSAIIEELKKIEVELEQHFAVKNTA